ncbi:MAG: tetratricopeptide repeat protein, partial [Fimbriimonadales bacterium]
QIWLWGDNPMPFHLANLLIHLVNTGLVMLLAGRWFGRGWAVVAVGALYGLHPALVESVAFVSSRYDLLTTTFLLIALLSEMILTGWKRLVGVGVSFLLALLCKEMAVVLWLLLPFWLWVKRRVGLVPSASPVPALPLFGVLLGVSLVYLGVRYLSLGYLLQPETSAQIEPGSPLQHLLLVGRTLATLLGLVYFPFFSITPAHHSELPVSPQDFVAWVQLVVGLGMLGLFAWLGRRVSPYGWLLVGGVATLFPVLNLRPMEFAYGIFTAERFLTFPLAVFLLGTTGIVMSMLRKAPVYRLALALTVAWGVGFAVVTALSLPNWKDDEPFWQWITRCAPNSPIGWSNLSDYYNKIGRHQEALEYAERSIAIAPESGMGWVNKGVALLRLGDPEGAIAMFRKGTELEPDNIIGWNNLAVMLSERGQLDEAEQIVRQHVLNKTPQFMGHQALGLIYTRRGRPDLAEEQFRLATQQVSVPENSLAYNLLKEFETATPWLAGAEQAIRRNELALAESFLQRAERLQPDRFAFGMIKANLHLAQNRPREAEQALQELLDYGYQDARIYGLLGLCAERQGDRKRAQQFYQKAQAQ